MITIGDTKLDTFVVLDEASLQCQLKMPDCQLCIAYGEKIVVDVVEYQIAGTAQNVATVGGSVLAISVDGSIFFKQKTAYEMPK